MRAAVVVGSAFDVTLVGELVGISPEAVVQRVEPAHRAGIIVESGDGYEFSNDLIREILYDTTPKPLRVVRHRRLVTLLDDHPEAAARHAAAAGNARLAVTKWCAAAERASAAFANREAEQLLTSAFDVSASLGDERTTAGILLAHGRVRLALGRYAAASADLLAAEQLAHTIGATELETAALTERAWAAYHARDIVQAASLAQDAAGRCRGRPTRRDPRRSGAQRARRPRRIDHPVAHRGRRHRRRRTARVCAELSRNGAVPQRSVRRGDAGAR